MGYNKFVTYANQTQIKELVRRLKEIKSGKKNIGDSSKVQAPNGNFLEKSYRDLSG